MANGDGSNQDPGLGTTFLTLGGPERAGERVAGQFQEGNFPLPFADPTAFSVDPVTRDTDEVERLLRRRGEQQAQSLREVAEQAEEERQRARQRTMFNLLGPNAFQAFTGEDVETGLEETLRLQREAEARARELEREATLQAPQSRITGDLEAEQTEAETETQNQQAQQEADLREAEATRQFAEGVRDLSGTMAEAQAERASGGGGGGFDMDRQDYIETTRNNPSLRNNEQWLRRGQMLDIPSSVTKQVGVEGMRETMPSSSSARDINDQLVQLDQYQPVGPEERQEVQQTRQNLLRDLQETTARTINNTLRDVQQGNATRSQIQDAIETAAFAESRGVTSVTAGQNEYDLTETRQRLLEAYSQSAPQQQPAQVDSASMQEGAEAARSVGGRPAPRSDRGGESTQTRGRDSVGSEVDPRETPEGSTALTPTARRPQLTYGPEEVRPQGPQPTTAQSSTTSPGPQPQRGGDGDPQERAASPAEILQSQYGIQPGSSVSWTEVEGGAQLLVNGRPVGQVRSSADVQRELREIQQLNRLAQQQ